VTEPTNDQQTAARLAAIVESSDDAIVSKTLDGMITSWNHGAERMFGYAAVEAVGQHITLVIPPDCLDEENTVLASIRAGRRIEHFESVRVAKDGRQVSVSITVSPVKDSSGRIRPERRREATGQRACRGAERGSSEGCPRPLGEGEEEASDQAAAAPRELDL
jgi:PAS domain S-box-containing protein